MSTDDVGKDTLAREKAAADAPAEAEKAAIAAAKADREYAEAQAKPYEDIFTPAISKSEDEKFKATES